jgi:hypothetical protein
MGILSELVWAVLYLSCTAIDMMLILLFFRIAGHWRRIGWVETVNQTAAAVVDRLNAALSRRWRAWTAQSLSPEGALALSVFTLSLARFLLCAIAGLLRP